MTRKIKDKYPMANIVAVDYDPSAQKGQSKPIEADAEQCAVKRTLCEGG